MKKSLVLKPDYYDKFSCVGSSCQQNCCREWSIHISKEEYRRINNTLKSHESFSKGSFFHKLAPAVRTDSNYTELRLNEKNCCPFLNKEKLCLLQCNFGKELLPDICASFPRVLFDNGDIVCAGLSPSCEAVLELLPTHRPITFVIQKEDISSAIQPLPVWRLYPENRYPFFACSQDIYSFCILLLQASDFCLEDRLILLGLSLRHIETLSQNGHAEKIPSYTEHYIRMLENADDIRKLMPEIKPNTAAFLSNITSTDIFSVGSSSGFQHLIKQTFDNLNISVIDVDENGEKQFSASQETLELYRKKKEKLEKVLEKGPFFIENLMVTLLLYNNLPFQISKSRSLMDGYLYFCWTYSCLKFVLTANCDKFTIPKDMIPVCVTFLRHWAHNNSLAEFGIRALHENGSDTIAHMALLLKSC